jgi:hypothetical protein
MKLKSILLTAAATLGIATSVHLHAQVTRPVGINISYVADYSTELVFTNAFLQCRDWISCNANNTGPWDTQISVPLRPDGYPIELPYDDGVNLPQKLKTLMIWDLFSATPTGTFRLKSSGTGQIKLTNGATGTYNSPVDTLVQVTGGVILELMASDINDPVHDIKFILPGYINTYQTQTFTSEFLDFLSDFQVIRFMDFTNTNGSPVVSWSDRTTPDYYTQGKFGGVAWDYVVQLANITQKDIWINIPHKADNAFLDSLANFLQNGLDPSIKIYLEYSNEVWNGAFSQNADCAQMAQNLGYTGQQWERAWKYTAKRSSDVFKAFSDVFTDDTRIIKIIPSQAANSWVTNQIVNFFNDPFYNPHQVGADAIAIGPYFGHNVANDIANAGLASTILVPDIIDSLQLSFPEAQGWIMANKTVADNHNLDLIVYEGGQHLVATGNNINNDTLTQKLIAANRDTAMYGLYCDYFDFWYGNVGNLFCHFSSTQRYTKWGSWGLMENQQDTLNPKYRSLEDCIFSFNSIPTAFGTPNNLSDINIFPNPSDGLVFLDFQDGRARQYQLFDATGKLLETNTGRAVSLVNLAEGLYVIRIENRTFRVIKK